MTLSPLNVVFAGILCLFGIGLYGLLTMHNLIKVIIALQILVKGVVLALVMAGSVSGQLNLGQSIASVVIVGDTVVAVIGLTLAVQVKRHLGTLDVKTLSSMRG